MYINTLGSICVFFVLLSMTACNHPGPEPVGSPSLAAGSIDLADTADIVWDSSAPAGMKELQINSAGSLLQGFMYTPNGKQPHPTLLLLHGFPGNERNLDIAQAVRRLGWNVIFFDYRGSWGSQGTFSFRHCVEDVGNVVGFCKQYADSLHIDTSNIVLFGHSMGAWTCLQALRRLPGIKKGFACSTWDLGSEMTRAAKKGQLEKEEKNRGNYFVLNSSGRDMTQSVLQDTVFHDLLHHGAGLQDKQVFMLDEHERNRDLADSIRLYNKAGFRYEVWKTDHLFTNKRKALIKAVIGFLKQ